MKVVRKVSELRSAVQQWRAARLSVALVPTMGALHAAHAALVADARNRADRVVATIFVNPRQFGDDEDLAEYPRTEEADLRQLRGGGVDLVFAPPVDEMYPERFATTVILTGPAEGLCGAARPGHFDGVATVVAKLLLQCLPDVAVFGEKDYQQLLVIRRMAQDLDISAQIVGVPTVREADGLACSSRNGYLSQSERASAPALYQSLRSAAQQISRWQRRCAYRQRSARFDSQWRFPGGRVHRASPRRYSGSSVRSRRNARTAAGRRPAGHHPPDRQRRANFLTAQPLPWLPVGLPYRSLQRP